MKRAVAEYLVRCNGEGTATLPLAAGMDFLSFGVDAAAGQVTAVCPGSGAMITVYGH